MQIGADLSEKFFRKFNYRFQNDNILLEALTHRSYIHGVEAVGRSSERLEFLGDSVLGLIIAEHLYKTNPDYNEGDLTKTKALLVNECTLSKVGQESGLNEMILLSPEEEKSGGRFRPSIISDAVEAVIGAIYLDGGIGQAWEFISHLIIERADEIFADSTQQNYKGELLEYLQRLGQPPPYYEVVSEEGPDHDKTFNVIVRAGSRIDGMGSGPSKKEAEQRAAEMALEKINLKDDENSEGLKED
jgi:ribonuclease-3